MKKFLTLLLTVALTATLAITGTVAYLTDTDSDVNVMTLGNVKIEQIEQQRDANGALESFKQGKPAFPAVGPVEWTSADQGVEINGTKYKVFVPGLKNVVDKFVTVKNTGISPAYVRTIVAIEEPDDVPNDLVHYSYNDQGITVTVVGKVEIKGVKYFVVDFTYNEALAPKATSAPSLMQLFLDSKGTNEYCAKFGSTWDVLVLSQAAQVDGFTDAATALNTAFGSVDETNVQGWFGSTAVSAPSDDAELEDSLTDTTSKTIVVTLTDDMTYDVAAWANDAMGGDVTEEIIINGNGHTLTFNQTNSDWNNIVTNGAKLVLNDVKLTNAGHNNGPWNRHDLNFECDVEMNNVTSDKAFAFKANATLNNVTIDDANTSDTYAIWIQPKGQTVTLDGCTIDMLDAEDGRGIKIDNQYIAAADEKKVTLVVKNTTLKTEEKSAILVKSTVGADITLDTVDITGVAADSTNPVWVDTATAAYADLVTVTGGTKIVEP